jgi:hypothetical protein
VLLLLGVLSGGGATAASGITQNATGASNPYVHTLGAADPVAGNAALQSTGATTVAYLGIAPRQAWQSRYEQLKPSWDVPIPARSVVYASGIDARASYLATIRVAATGSVSFRATSLPPPAI